VRLEGKSAPGRLNSKKRSPSPDSFRRRRDRPLRAGPGNQGDRRGKRL